MRGTRRRQHAVAALVAAWVGILWIWMVPAALAHPYLVQTVPGPGVIVRNPPTAIQIGFTERVVLKGSSLRLVDSVGHPLVLGPVHEPKEGPGLAADVKGALGGDVYLVRWVVLGQDGHTSSGEYRFGVNGPNGSPPRGAGALSAAGGRGDQVAASDGLLRIALRWMGLLGASLLVGGAVLATRLRGRLEPDVAAIVSARWARLGRVAWVLTLTGSIAAFLAAANAGVGGARLAVVLASSTGALAVARLIGVVVTGVPGVLSAPGPRRDRILGLAGALFLGAEAVGGHITALTGFRLPAIAAQIGHLGAAALWVGGLAVLAYAMAAVPDSVRPSAWRTAASAYRPIAGVSAVVVIGTGVVASVREVQHRYFLAWSIYGRFLLTKWVLVAAMLVLGGLTGRDLVSRRGAPSTVRPGKSAAGFLRTEAVLGLAVLVFAATLVGVAQGRGQPLPAQRGSVLAGPALANAVVAGGLARLALIPAAPGLNRLTALMASPVEAATAGANQTPATGPVEPKTVDVALECACAGKAVQGRLTRAAGPGAALTGSPGVWRVDVDLPAAGVWHAALTVDGATSLAPVALRVDDGSAPGAPSFEISSIADLSGPEARRCRSFQLGMVLALGFLNAKGGVGGRKVVLRAADDGGDPTRARKLAEAVGRAHLAAPCGAAAGAAAQILQRKIPVVLADAKTPPVAGRRIFRLAADPYAEGWAAGRTVARSGFVGRTDAPRRISVVVDEGDPSADRAIAGLKAALALDPSVAKTAEGTASASAADVEVQVTRHQRDMPLLPSLQEAVNGERYVAAFLYTDPAPLGLALDQLSDSEIGGAAAILVPSRAFDETFYRSSKIGRRGDVKVFGEVAPDSAESLLYAGLVFTIFPGEQPSIDGLRGYLAGKAIVASLAGGTSTADIARRLQLLGFFSDGVVSGWSPAAPASGSWRFFLFKGSFIPSGLIPGAAPEPGRYFAEGGAWSRVATGNVGLCGPQLSADGPPPPCTAPPYAKPPGKGAKKG
jgi:methionine-rich copper-binding protein CopC/putative copper export protein